MNSQKMQIDAIADSLREQLVQTYCRQMQVLAFSLENRMALSFAGRPFLWGVGPDLMVRDFFLLSRPESILPRRTNVSFSKTWRRLQSPLKPDENSRETGDRMISFGELFRERFFLKPGVSQKNSAVQLSTLIKSCLPEETSPVVLATMLAALDPTTLSVNRKSELFAAVKEKFHLLRGRETESPGQFSARFIPAANRFYELAMNRTEKWEAVRLIFRTFIEGLRTWYGQPVLEFKSHLRDERKTEDVTIKPDSPGRFPVWCRQLPWSEHFRQFPEDQSRLREEWAHMVLEAEGECPTGWIALSILGSRKYDAALLKAAQKQLHPFFTSPLVKTAYWRSINVFLEWQPEDPSVQAEWKHMWWTFTPPTFDIDDQRHLLKWRVLSRQETDDEKLLQLFKQHFTWLMTNNQRYSLLIDNGLMELAQWVPHSPTIRGALHSWWNTTPLPKTQGAPVAHLMAHCLLTEDSTEVLHRLGESPVLNGSRKVRPESEKYLHFFFENLLSRHPDLPRKMTEAFRERQSSRTDAGLIEPDGEILFRLHCPGEVVLSRLQSQTTQSQTTGGLNTATRMEINTCLRKWGLPSDTDRSLLRRAVDMEIAAAHKCGPDSHLHLQTALRLYLEQFQWKEDRFFRKSPSSAETMENQVWMTETLQYLISHPELPLEDVVDATRHPFSKTNFFDRVAAPVFLERLTRDLKNIEKRPSERESDRVSLRLLCMWGVARVLHQVHDLSAGKTDTHAELEMSLNHVIQNEPNHVVVWAAVTLAVYLRRQTFACSGAFISKLWAMALQKHNPPQISGVSGETDQDATSPADAIPFLTINLARMESILQAWPDQHSLAGEDAACLQRNIRQLLYQYSDPEEQSAFHIWPTIWASWYSILKASMQGENLRLEADLEKQVVPEWGLPHKAVSGLPDAPNNFLPTRLPGCSR